MINIISTRSNKLIIFIPSINWSAPFSTIICINSNFAIISNNKIIWNNFRAIFGNKSTWFNYIIPRNSSIFMIRIIWKLCISTCFVTGVFSMWLRICSVIEIPLLIGCEWSRIIGSWSWMIRWRSFIWWWRFLFGIIWR